jgi:hypothetical protein
VKRIHGPVVDRPTILTLAVNKRQSWLLVPKIYFRPVLYLPTISGRHSKNIDFPAPMLRFDPAVARYMAYNVTIVIGSRMYMANGFVMRTEHKEMLTTHIQVNPRLLENSHNNAPKGAVIIDLIHFDFVI